MPTPSTTILSLDAQLSLLYAIALHYDTELSNLYHELFMKSLKDDETRKINLDDILKERRIVENEILTIRMMKKSVPLMQRLVLLGTRLIEHGGGRVCEAAVKGISIARHHCSRGEILG